MNLMDLLVEAAAAARSSQTGRDYQARHGVRSAPTLTVNSDEVAGLIADHLEPRIRDKTVIDVGGGIGLLGLHMAAFARRVFVIEASPIWSAAYLDLLHRAKPANLSFLFGAALEFVGHIEADIAIVATHSDVAGLMSIASRFAPVRVDVYGELIASNPFAFDEWARDARSRA